MLIVGIFCSLLPQDYIRVMVVIYVAKPAEDSHVISFVSRHSCDEFLRDDLSVGIYQQQCNAVAVEFRPIADQVCIALRIEMKGSNWTVPGTTGNSSGLLPVCRQ